MPAIQKRIATAVADALEAADIGKAAVVKRGWLNTIGAADLTTEGRMFVVMLPLDDPIESTDNNGGRRGHLQLDVPIRVLFMAKLGKGHNDFEDQCDTAAEDAENLWQMFAFSNYELSALDGVYHRTPWVLDCQMVKTCDAEKLRQHSIYESEILLTVRLWLRP